jgi:lycopene beta-cyclase
MVQVVVLGAGPTALTLAAACAERGVQTVVLGGANAPWAPNYGIWVDDAERLGLRGYLAAEWRDSDVVFEEGEVTSFGRAYAKVARRRLRVALLERLARAGGEVQWSRARSVTHDAQGSVVEVEGGGPLRATLVVDATGHQPVAIHRPAEATAFQAAVGMFAEVKEHPWPTDRFVFMDWRPADALALRDGPPSFLYVMPFSPTRVFVEETSLVHAPAVPFALLRDRLRRRLARMGVGLDSVLATELCLIPMNPALPALNQRALGFGAAASLVHPATGYQLVRSLELAPTLAACIAAGLAEGRPPAHIAAEGWGVLWPSEARARRGLLSFGSDFAGALDHAECVSFFRAFMGLPTALRDGYLSGDSPLGTTLTAMMGTFVRCPPSLRWRLLRSGVRLPSHLIGGMQPGRSRKGEPECP